MNQNTGFRGVLSDLFNAVRGAGQSAISTVSSFAKSVAPTIRQSPISVATKTISAPSFRSNLSDLVSKVKPLAQQVTTRAANTPILPFTPGLTIKNAPNWQAPLEGITRRIPSQIKIAAPGLQIPEMAGETVRRYGRTIQGKANLEDYAYNALDLMPVFGGVKARGFTYKQAANLSPEARALESKFGKYLTQNFKTAVSDYLSKFGKVINTDNARELSAEYAASPEVRSRFSAAVHEPASEFAKRLYQILLKEKDPTGNNIVLFTAGGTGSGKTSAIRNVPEAKGIMDIAQIVYDTNLNRFSSAKEKIDMAIRAGKKVVIEYVHADPMVALDRMIGRAQRIGRTVPMENHIDTHVGSLDTIKQLIKHYSKNENVQFFAIDNTGPKGSQRLMDMEKLGKMSYNTAELGKGLYEKLETLYKAGSVPKTIYEGIKGAVQDARGSLKGVLTPESTVQLTKSGGDQLNLEHFDIPKAARKRLEEGIRVVQSELESIRGRKLSHEEVLNAAQSSGVLRRVVSRDQTKAALASVTRLRQRIAASVNKPGIDKQFFQDLQTLRGFSQDAARRLNILGVGADPNAATVKEEIVKKLIDLGANVDEVIKAGRNVDFNSPKQVADFYRSFVKPTLGEVLDEYRYVNLLSSPRTHIVNAFSNMLQAAVVNPGTKLFSGIIDNIASGLTGKQQEHYIREVPAYYRGALNSIGDAFSKFANVVSGNQYIARPDVNHIPTGKLGPLEIVTRLLEGGDVFFRTIVEGGELESLALKNRAGTKMSRVAREKQAAEGAAYSVFRKDLDPTNKTGQGALLSGIDQFTEAVYKLRNAPGVKYFIPFVQTPMNILKQMIEYSPAGVATIPGSKDAVEQLGKAAMGSMVMLGASWLVNKGDVTWDAPTSEKEKALFYASGRKPYSVRIGDQWYSYSKLGPLSMPIAMAAAMKYYQEQYPKSVTDTSTERVMRVLGGIARFFSDQSYLTGINNLVRTVQGEPYAAARALGDVPRQFVPMSALLSWVTGIVDPIYREAKNPVQKIEAGIPGLSKNVPSYKDMAGNEQKKDYPLINAVSPIGVSEAKDGVDQFYKMNQLYKQSKQIVEKLKQMAEQGQVDPTVAQEAIKRLEANAESMNLSTPDVGLPTSPSVTPPKPKTPVYQPGKAPTFKIKKGGGSVRLKTPKLKIAKSSRKGGKNTYLKVPRRKSYTLKVKSGQSPALGLG